MSYSKNLRLRQQRSTGRRALGGHPTRLRPSDIYSKLTDTELNKLADTIRLQAGWSTGPKACIMAMVRAQLEGVDAMLQAATGIGKTTVAAGPHMHPGHQGMCSLLVVPLMQLEDELVETFEKEFGLRAVAIHSQNGGLSPQTVERILQGDFNIVITSPEMLQSRTFINRILRDTRFTRRLLSMVIDEAHCISHWGANFRKKYGTLGIVRAFFPKGVPVIAVTATLTARVRRDIQSKLHFPKTGSIFWNESNDRPNVSIVVRACHHAMNTFRDLEFILPDTITKPDDIPKTWIYVDDINEGNLIVDHLADLLSKRCSGISRGIIRPFNATLSHNYRREAMVKCRAGEVRIMVCTDAAGMGCNIPDVDMVVQWKLPATLSNFIQRAGRAARGRQHVGLAVLLVERSVYSVILREDTVPKARRRRRPGRKKGQAAADPETQPLPKKSKAESTAEKRYAREHGVDRGGPKGKDTISDGVETVLNIDSPEEGLHAFVQTTQCRRRIWAVVFDNDPNNLPTRPKGISCCDICDPALLDRTRPSRTVRASSETQPVKGACDETLRARLIKWRRETFERNHRTSALAPSAILDSTLVQMLACHGAMSRQQFQGLLEPKWVWWKAYGGVLYDFWVSLDLAVRVKPPRKRAKKSAAADDGLGAAAFHRFVTPEPYPEPPSLPSQPSYTDLGIFIHCSITHPDAPLVETRDPPPIDNDEPGNQVHLPREARSRGRGGTVRGRGQRTRAPGARGTKRGV